MGMSNALIEDSLTYYLTDGTPATRPTGWYISLHWGDPGEAGDLREVDDANYERQPISFSLAPSPMGGTMAQNSDLVEFPPAGSDYEVAFVCVWDDNDRLLLIQSLRVPKFILASEQAQIAPAEITIGAL